MVFDQLLLKEEAIVPHKAEGEGLSSVVSSQGTGQPQAKL